MESSKNPFNQANDTELINIYTLLNVLTLNSEQSIHGSLNVKLFPRKFIIKLIDERLAKLNKLADDLVSKLFKRLLNNSKQINERLTDDQLIKQHFITRCFEFDEYFHFSLHYLHDFIIELNWHESFIEHYLTNEDLSFIKDKLKRFEDFLSFREKLFEFYETQSKKPQDASSDNLGTEVSKTKTLPPPPSRLSKFKSSLSSARSSRVDSPSQRRQIRFKDSPTDVLVGLKQNQDRKDSHSVLALDLLIYSINLFLQSVCNQLVEWSTNCSDISEQILLLKESRNKIKSIQLNSLAKQIKESNDVHLTILEHLTDLRKIYLSDFLLNILCIKDSEKLLKSYKKPHIDRYIQLIDRDLERKLIFWLANQNLQLLFDLIINDINLPPVDLNDETGRQSYRKGPVRSSENHFNFIANWLNLDEFVFGFINPKLKKPLSSVGSSAKVSNLSGPFKSSSRLLAQMDNLDVLANDLLREISGRLHSNQQLRYFFGLLVSGLEHVFVRISTELLNQLRDSNQKESPELADKTSSDVNQLMKNLNSIAPKVRCLKLIHFFTSMGKTIKHLASKNKIYLNAIDILESKLNEFSNNCGQRAQSN